MTTARRFPAYTMITLRSSNLFRARKNKKLMRSLYSLTLRGWSEMRSHMHSVMGEYAKDYKIILAKTENGIAGWALLPPYGNDRQAHFYVASAYRRRGIGSLLYKKALQLCKREKKDMYCSAWDATSSRFFSKHKAKTYGETWKDITSSSPMDIYLD